MPVAGLVRGLTRTKEHSRLVQSLLITRHIPRCNILTKNACNREYTGSEAGAPCPHYPHAPSSDLLPLRLSILARNRLVQAESDTKLEGCEDLLLRYSKFDLPKYPHSCFHRLVLLASGQDKLQSRTYTTSSIVALSDLWSKH